MKKIIFALSAVALMVGCANEPVETPIELEKTTTVTVEVTPEQQTRTYTEGNKIYWNATGEQLNIIYFADESTNRRQSATHANYTLTENKATFTADLTTTEGATKYTLGAYYPYVSKYSTSSISLDVPQEQTPSATSYDPKADILVSKNPVVSNGLPDKLTFEFARMVAFAKMTIKGISAGEKIEKVVFSSSAKPAGTVVFKVHEPGTLDNAKWYNNYEDITLNLGGREATGEDTVWFVTVPTDLSDTDFTVEVTTDKNIYTKTVDLTGKTLNFERANIAQFSVSGLTVVENPNASTEAQTITFSFPENFPEGVASGKNVGTIYSGDVIISSTGSWRTDKTDGRDCIYIGRTTSNELRIEAQNGKTITKVTLGAPVGYLVDLTAKEFDRYTTTTFANATTAEWTGECKSRIVYTAVGSSHSNIATITVEYK